ncbi:MAG: replicative DNA helicase [Parcubacteria group bacterium LiPW_30]|nr:MAG: replicative DNA helicase [Parcubacteria group bacterium LiPW_30]
MAQSKGSSVRVPPQNIDSEKALLGALMVRADAINEIVDSIEPDSFYAEKHRIIYNAIRELFAKNEPIDVITVSSRLNDKNDLERIGGRAYLVELINTVPSTSNVLHYANLVDKTSILRRLIDAADHISDLGFTESKELDQVLDEAEKKIFGITNSPKVHKFVNLKDTLTEAWERLDHLHKSGDEIRGVPTGFPDLDLKTAGFQKSDLIILAARPSMGKTALALDIARMAATKHNVPIGIFSLEMSAHQLTDRMLAAESRVDSWKLRTGKITADEDFSRLRDAMSVLSKAPIYIDDQAGNSILKMRSVARRLKSEHGLGMIIVDYLQLMTTSKNYDSMVNQVTEISRSLKSLARELDIPVLALSQLSRAVESRGGRPRLSDLRDSGSIEQDADLVMFIHREDKYKDDSERPNIAEILIEKHRNGPTGKIELYFDDKKTTFLPVDKGDYATLDKDNDF